MPLSRLLKPLLMITAAGTLSSASAAERLGLPASPASIEFVRQRTQFQLHALLTEQRHPSTWSLSQVAAADPEQALQQLFSVDRDVIHAFDALAADRTRMASLHAASASVLRALRAGHRIYFYGTGSTGRLAETLESGVWRPFWRRLQDDPAWPLLAKVMPSLEERVRGEITGGDRALISSLEGFEDLPQIGALQLRDDGIGPDDVVFAVTEGGETSAVIGAALAAADQGGAARDRVWFVYNNPDPLLRPFDRSRQVLDDPRIGKIPLPTGPQALAGSTRMQATTTSLYVLGLILEDALRQWVVAQLDAATAQRLGFSAQDSLESRLRDFAGLQRSVAASAPGLAALTEREARIYAEGGHANYMAQAALMPVFVDVTERAPTFRLAPLDRVDAAESRSWVRVSAPVAMPDAAWMQLLGRPFHGLDPSRYRHVFEHDVTDEKLRDTALASLTRAGGEQQFLYDLSWSQAQAKRSAPQRGDLGVLLLYADEAMNPTARAWLQAHAEAGAGLMGISIGRQGTVDAATAQATLPERVSWVKVALPAHRDPLGLDRILAMKMLLNAHSTAVMARLGRTVGNTMTAVQPGNLKLIGRATYLIQLHVNAVLASTAWRHQHPPVTPLSYAEANEALYAAMAERTRSLDAAQIPEVELAIVAVLERLGSGRPLDWSGAAHLLQSGGLNAYLAAYD